MASKLASLTAALAFSLLLHGGRIPSARAQPGEGTVLSGATIRTAGAVRLSDVWWLLPGVRIRTLDGFSVDAQPAPGHAGGSLPVEVRVDGVPVLNVGFGALNLNELPLPLERIEEARYFAEGNDGYRGPVLDFVSRRHHRPAGAAAISLQNETGDPGPYRYTEEAPPNIDGQGPDGALLADFPLKRSILSADAVAILHHATDEDLLLRNAEVYYGPGVPVISLRNVVFAGKIGLSGRGRKRFNAALSANQVRDFRFAEPFGHELPILTRSASFSAWRTPERGRLSGWITGSYGWTEERTNGLSFPIDLEQHAVSGLLRRRLRIARSRSEMGIRGSWRRAQAPAMGLDPTGEVEVSAYGSTVISLSERTRIRADFSAATDGKWLAPYARASIGVGRAVGTEVWLTVDGGLLLPEAENTYVSWYRAGLRPGTAAVPTLVRQRPQSTAGGRLTLSRSFTMINLQGEAFIRTTGNALLVDREVQYEAVLPQITRQVFAHAGGTEVGGSFGAHVARRRAELMVSADSRRIVQGDPLFKAESREIPATAVRARLSIPVADPFVVQAQFAHFSSSFWDEYADAAASPAERTAARVPAVTRADLTFSLQFLQGHATAMLSFENFLNSTARYHPIGGRFDRAARLRLTIRV